MNTLRTTNAGITLLEVLLSFAVMAMIGIGIGSLFQTGNQVWQRIDANASVSDEAVNRAELRRQMEGMATVSPNAPLTALLRVETGMFSFQLSDELQSSEPVWKTIKLVETTLVIEDETSGSILPARTSVSQIAITYFGRKTVRDEARWHDNWADATILPRLIKIESWQSDGTANPPMSIQPAILARQMDISLSSLVPPG